jgi:hypothetical protein
VFNFSDYKRDANRNYTQISSLQLEWPYSKELAANAGKDGAKQEPLYTAGGNIN